MLTKSEKKEILELNKKNKFQRQIATQIKRS